MSEKLTKRERKYARIAVNETLRTDMEDVINILCKQGFWTRWYFAMRVLWAAKSKVEVPMSVIKNAEKK